MSEAKEKRKAERKENARPVTERLARMEGMTSYRDPRERAGSGCISLTDHDVMAALSMIRRYTDDTHTVKDPNDIGPELMETYFGSNIRHRELLARWFEEHHGKQHNGDVDSVLSHVTMRRLGATLAAQMVAGHTMTGGEWAFFAWTCGVRKETFIEVTHFCRAIFYAELDKAEAEFKVCLSQVREYRQSRKEEAIQAKRNARDLQRAQEGEKA